MKKGCLLILSFCIFQGLCARHSGTTGPEPKDTESADSAGVSTGKPAFFRKILDYFAEANREKSDQAFDFSLIGGPHYSSDTKLGLGLVAAGLYRSDRSDTLLPLSNVSLYGDITTTGFYLLGVRGNHLFPGDRFRLVYNLYFFSFPGYFWGIGYHNGRNDANKSAFKRLQNQVKIDFLVRLSNHLFAGPNVSFDYAAGKDFARPELLEGERQRTVNAGLGVELVYDSRDFIPNPYRGFYLKAEQRTYPGGTGNTPTFSRTDVTADYYRQLWKGAVAAVDFHAQLNYGDVPWTMLAPLGGSYRMRGYYEGRYRDRNLMEFQAELRQHVWRRNSVTVWAGAGQVFPDFRRFNLSHTLPDFGVGYRWEFKKRVNVRLDMGFGRGESGFLFNINEAF